MAVVVSTAAIRCQVLGLPSVYCIGDCGSIAQQKCTSLLRQLFAEIDKDGVCMCACAWGTCAVVVVDGG